MREGVCVAVVVFVMVLLVFLQLLLLLVVSMVVHLPAAAHSLRMCLAAADRQGERALGEEGIERITVEKQLLLTWLMPGRVSGVTWSHPPSLLSKRMCGWRGTRIVMLMRLLMGMGMVMRSSGCRGTHTLTHPHPLLLAEPPQAMG